MKSLFILLLCVVSGNLYAQNWNLLQLPNETKHPEDLFNITRPALSLRGWDNARTNAETSYFTTYWHTTFGVKQVLISSFSDMETSETILFRKIRDYRNRTITTGYLDGKQDANSINSNAIILESRAFTALMTYIIDKNDGGLGEPNVFTADVKNRVTNLPNFDQARISLLSAFRQLIDYHYANNLSNGARFFTNMGFDDTFKNTTAIMAVARAFDFYLALENAALFYGDNTISNQLLTTNERRLVNALLAKEIDLVHYETSEKNLIPYNLLFGLDVTLDEVQAGNWPLISKIGIAYASLGMNGTSILNPNFSSNYFYNRLVDGIVASSPVRTLGYAQTIRDNHFFYQTQGNTSFAEGFYYYKITLSKLLPFYNVLRTNNVLQLNSITGVDDPIRHPNFEKTLHWVADLSTPDGKTLPLDDGNKVDLDISEIFRWSNVFGNQEIGQKYAWLRTRIGDVSDWFNTTSIAIPKVSAPNQSPISNVYPYSGISNADQLAVRFSDAQNRNHMVVLNTESLLAVEPSEGHEQPDQLQLLYYVDDKSIIADAGYDKGGTAEASATYPFVQAVNSSWSKMSNHNVFRMEHRESLSDPVLTTDAWIGKKANHGGIKNKSLVEHGNLYMLSGTMEIIAGQSNIFTDPKIADYRRNLLVIEGDLNTDPYIIDSNSHVFYSGLKNLSYIMGYESTRAKITYLVDSQNFTLNKWGISEFYFGNEMLKLFTCPTPYVRYTPFQDITSNNKFREKSGGTEELGSIFETSFIMPYEEDGSAKEKNIISVISLTNKAMNIERMYDDVYKGNPTYSGEYAAYKINHGNAVDFVVKRILLNGIGGYNPNFDGWNMRFKSGSIVFEFPGGNEFAFARYVNQSGKWVLDETRKLNIVDKTIDQINQNVTVGNNETVSPNKYIHLVNNITVTVNGDANLNGKTFKMGNNSKIRFISGNPDLTNLIIESNTPSDNYYIELGASYPLILSSNEKMIIGGKANLTGYRIQVNQGGELEIKDGSTVTLTDSFQFYNSGTTKIGSGVTMQLKNLTSYSSGNLLINQNSGTQTTLNISANGVINIQGLATVKKTDFIKSGTSNFSHVSITGNQAKSFENTHIEGSQYGFLVNNVATSNQVLFKNVTGMNNYYATIKASNSYFYIDGFEGIGAIQDGLGAYSGSIITLVGNVNVTSNLLGLRSAYNSNISFISDGNSSANVRMNTRGIQAYTDSRIDLYGGELSLWGNTRVDNLYGGISRFDLHVSDNSDIFIIGELDGIHGLTEFKEAGSTITIENQNEGGVHKASGEKEELANSDKHAPSLTKKAFMNAFWNATKAVNKQAVKDVLKDNIANSKQEIRSKAIALEILNLAQAGDFSWVNTFNKRAKLHSFVEDDALLIAEQQFYYATQTQPDEQEAQYWLEQLKAMNHEAVATGLFDVLFEQAEFTKTSGDSDDEKDKKWTSKQTLDIAAYPNPFNPTTSLKFTLKESAMVNIQVYDIMGRLVQTLTNTQWQSGVHTVSFDASKLASGLYFARTQLLQSGVLVDQSITKLMLVK